MASTLQRSDPKLSAVLLRNYSYIPSDSIQDSLSGTMLNVEGQEYDVSSQSMLTPDRILTAINACFIISPKLYDELVDDEYINNMELLFANICKIKDWDRSIPCVRLLSCSCETMMHHKRRGNLQKVYRRILRKMCNSIAKYHISIDEKGADTTFELRNLYESTYFLRKFLLLLLSADIYFHIDIEPFLRSMRDIKILIIIEISKLYLKTRLPHKNQVLLDQKWRDEHRIWRQAALTVTFTDPKNIEREVMLMEVCEGLASFDYISAIFLPSEGDHVIELPLISCIDIHNQSDRLLFYFEVNLPYIKTNMPRVIASAFHNELGNQYRFCISCVKNSCITNSNYDNKVQDYHVSRILEELSPEKSNDIKAPKMAPKVSLAILELPQPYATPILHGWYCAQTDSGSPNANLQVTRYEELTKAQQSKIRSVADITFMPPSINKVTTTCTTDGSICGSVLMDEYRSDEKEPYCSKDVIYDISIFKTTKLGKKVSLAMLTIPPLNDIETVNMVEVPETNINSIAQSENTVDESQSTAPELRPLTKQEPETENKVHAPKNDSGITGDTISKPLKQKKKTIKRQTRKFRRLHSLRRLRKKTKALKGDSPIPRREHRQGYDCSFSKHDDEEDRRCPRSIVNHLKRACQLLIKRRNSSCSFVRKEFDLLRTTIETQFHLVLCRCQERWDRVNADYLKRLEDIVEDMEDELKLPKLDKLFGQLYKAMHNQSISNGSAS